MAGSDGKVRLVHSEGTLILPFWPSDISRDMAVRTYSELERANLKPLTVPSGLTNRSMSIGYTARQPRSDSYGTALYVPIDDHLDLLRKIAKSSEPASLFLAKDDRGKWHLESVQVTEIEWAPNGHPSVVDIALSLREATDVTINVGLIKRQRNQKPPAQDQEGNAPKDKKSPAYAKWYAETLMKKKYNWGKAEFNALEKLWSKESGWDYKAVNRSSGAWGIPQALPGSKMSTAGADWKTNPETQIKWGLGYIKDRYGTPTKAWQHSVENNWY